MTRPSGPNQRSKYRSVRVTADFTFGPPTAEWRGLMSRLLLGMPKVGRREEAELEKEKPAPQ